MSDIGALLETTVKALHRFEDPLLDAFLELLPPEPGPERDMAARWLPVCDHLLGRELNCAATTRPVVDAFLQGIHGFAWNQTYTADDFGAAFLERYGWVKLVGERGYFESSRLLMSFLVIGPRNTYPAHCHAPKELYVTLAGRASWIKSSRMDGDFIPRQPGEIIHHPAMIWHAVKTDDEPLIALALWRGENLNVKSDTGKG